MARVTWKENHIVSIETRKGLFVLAQMLKSPYLVFYKAYSESEDFTDIDLENTPILFVTGVTRQFLKESNIKKQKGIAPRNTFDLPKCRIQIPPGNRIVKVWEGAEEEREFITLGETPGGSLIEDDIMNPPEVFGHHPVVVPSIPLDDYETIDKYESTGVSIYPELNERLYLCHKLGYSIDPAKYVHFNRELPKECAIYVDIMSGKIEKEQGMELFNHRPKN